ncbi:hypothetical protein ACQ4PT_020928 [Festuca glaucescens]
MSVAAANLISRCDVSSHRRAGIWSDGCFLSYADTNATTPSDKALRARVIYGPADALARNASDSDLHRLAAVAEFLAPRAAVSDNMLAVAVAPAVVRNYAARRTVRVLAQCARDLPTAAECDLPRVLGARGRDVLLGPRPLAQRPPSSASTATSASRSPPRRCPCEKGSVSEHTLLFFM